MAAARKPSSASRREAASAASSSPTITGTIGLCASGRPAAFGEGFGLLHRQRGIGRLALDQVERGDAGGRASRRQAGRIDQRTRAVSDQIDHRRGSAQIAAVGADRFRQCAHQQRHRDMRIARKAGAAPAAEHAQPVRVVRHQPGIMLVGQRQQFGERRQVAVHGEHAVGHDQRVIDVRRDGGPAFRAHARRRCGGMSSPCRPTIARRRTDRHATTRPPAPARRGRSEPG